MSVFVDVELHLRPSVSAIVNLHQALFCAWHQNIRVCMRVGACVIDMQIDEENVWVSQFLLYMNIQTAS